VCRLRARHRARSGNLRGLVARDDLDPYAHHRAGGGNPGDGDGDDDRDRALIGIDHGLERWITDHRVSWLDPIFVGLTYAGSLGAVWIVIGIAVAAYLRRPTVALAVVAAVLAANLASTALKDAVDRRRPEETLPGLDPLVTTPSTPSFPSGHAAMSFAAAVVLVVAVPALAPAVVSLAILVSFSRAYVGVHYPLDVVGGAALGAAVATALLLLARTLRRSRSPRTRGQPTSR